MSDVYRMKRHFKATQCFFSTLGSPHSMFFQLNRHIVVFVLIFWAQSPALLPRRLDFSWKIWWISPLCRYLYWKVFLHVFMSVANLLLKSIFHFDFLFRKRLSIKGKTNIKSRVDSAVTLLGWSSSWNHVSASSFSF